MTAAMPASMLDEYIVCDFCSKMRYGTMCQWACECINDWDRANRGLEPESPGEVESEESEGALLAATSSEETGRC